ncbi:hypothetical protein BD289DRAFT_244262 [Coniella lustricola]|uniref:Uncharacterized protein n=1 Tax=Coniella lustricola TaxID=2025994 RepID=A0A2T3A992_9PEZI|nr:hypothetical protein BD289DRAFT_244262 [Coniella lustricola]
MSRYEAFWHDSQDVPILWVGLLFSTNWPLPLEGSAMLDTRRIHQYRPSCPSDIAQLRLHRVHYATGCLQGHTVLTGNLRQHRSPNGLPSDPSHFPRLAPLQRKMQRRMWSTVLPGGISLALKMKSMASSTIPVPRTAHLLILTGQLNICGGRRRFVRLLATGWCRLTSLASLELHHILHRETCPGGQLHTMCWRVSSI